MIEPALDALPEWPWPRWEFITATPTDDGITVALAPIAPHCTPDGRMVDATGAEESFDG